MSFIELTVQAIISTVVLVDPFLRGVFFGVQLVLGGIKSYFGL